MPAAAARNGRVSNGELRARHYATGQPMKLLWENGRVVSLDPMNRPPKENLWLAPALFDPQVNGYGGVDFQQDGLTLEQLLSAARQLRRDGCARFLFTLVTDEWPKLIARVRRARQLRDQSDELRRSLCGWHIEGPFLSEQPGFHGAHNPAVMCDPTPEHIRELRSTTGDDPVLLTLAPERKGSLEAIRLAVSLGIKI
ncbi:MAG: N-acetylglucosamine-6-phosphate deacetylase, partial [Verrucomicrobia bacterium]|nr:N-acetylglucosamine-6-phosphate deacetylase [Verrucomicrobiota bacterium]